MIPALVVLYVLFLGVAAGGSLWSFRLRKKFGLPFLKPFHVFVLVSFAYAVVNFIGEALAPAVFDGPAGSMIEIWLIVDLVTIPLLGVLFALLFSWIVRLLGRFAPPALKAVFWSIEAVFLTVFLTAFVSYFVRGISTVSYVEIYVLNGIVGGLLVASVLALLFAAPAGGDPDRRRLARGMGLAYALASAVLVAALAAPLASLSPRLEIANAVRAGIFFLFNLPALAYLQKALKTLPPLQTLTPPETIGLDALARDAGISEREKEIIRLVASGLDNRETGKRLFISPKTVKNHMTNIYAKTGARNRVQLVNLLNRPDQGPRT
jgi:DNA-binding CsgD family transcriptional regulator